MLKPQRSLLVDAAKLLATLPLDAQLAQQVGQRDEAEALAQQLHDAAQPERDAASAKVNDARHYALAETPQAFAKRVGAYWSAWRSV